MTKQRCSMKKSFRIFKNTLTFWLLFTIYVPTEALELNGLAIHSELDEEKFIAAIYAQTLTSDSVSLVQAIEPKRIEIRFLNNMSLRQFKRMWVQSISINNSPNFLKENADSLVTFVNSFNLKFENSDIVAIESKSDSTSIFQNNIKIGQIDSTGIMRLLLNAWIGSVPPSSEFRSSLLSNGDIPSTLLGKYENIKPSSDRQLLVAQAQAKKQVETIPETPTSQVAFKSKEPPQIIDASVIEKVNVDKTTKKTAIVKQATEAKTTTLAKTTLAKNSTAKIDTPTEKSAPNSQKSNPPKKEFKPTLSAESYAVLQTANASPTTSDNEESLDTKDASDNKPFDNQNQPTINDSSKPEGVLASNIIIPDELDDFTLDTQDLLAEQEYLIALRNWYNKKLRYPRTAMQREQTGSVSLSVTLDRNGEVQDVNIVREARYSALNIEARKAVKRANPFPGIPKNIEGNEYIFTLPVTFALDE